MSLFPKILCDPNRIDLQVFPPSHFITRLMQLPVMAAAKRYGELIADFQANGARLGKPSSTVASIRVRRRVASSLFFSSWPDMRFGPTAPSRRHRDSIVRMKAGTGAPMWLYGSPKRTQFSRDRLIKTNVANST